MRAGGAWCCSVSASVSELRSCPWRGAWSASHLLFSCPASHFPRSSSSSRSTTPTCPWRGARARCPASCSCTRPPGRWMPLSWRRPSGRARACWCSTRRTTRPARCGRAAGAGAHQRSRGQAGGWRRGRRPAVPRGGWPRQNQHCWRVRRLHLLCAPAERPAGPCSEHQRAVAFVPPVHKQVFSRAELQLVADLCLRHDCLVLLDEVYEHLVSRRCACLTMSRWWLGLVQLFGRPGLSLTAFAYRPVPYPAAACACCPYPAGAPGPAAPQPALSAGHGRPLPAHRLRRQNLLLHRLEGGPACAGLRFAALCCAVRCRICRCRAVLCRALRAKDLFLTGFKVGWRCLPCRAGLGRAMLCCSPVLCCAVLCWLCCAVLNNVARASQHSRTAATRRGGPASSPARASHRSPNLPRRARQVGWLSGPRDMVKAVAQAHQFLVFTVPPALQVRPRRVLPACWACSSVQREGCELLAFTVPPALQVRLVAVRAACSGCQRS